MVVGKEAVVNNSSYITSPLYFKFKFLYLNALNYFRVLGF